MAKAATLNLDIVAKADKALETFDKVKEKATGGFSAVKVGVMAAATGILAGLGAATAAAAEHQQSVAKLDQAYKNAGISTKDMGGALEEIETRSRRTGQSTEDNIAAYTELVTVTKNTAKAHAELGVAQDLAAYKGVSVKDATEAIIRASQGNTRALKDMGIATTDAAGKQLPTAVLMGKLEKAVHGQADALGKTASGEMARYHQSLDQTKEKIGTALLPVLQKFLDILQPLFTWIDKHQRLMKILAPIVAGVAGAIYAVVIAMRLWAIIQGIVNALLDANPIGLVILAVAALAGGIIYAWNHFKWFRDAIKEVWDFLKKLGEWVAAHWKLIVDILLGPVGILLTHLKDVKHVIEDVIGALEAVGRAVSKALGWLGKVGGKVLGAIGLSAPGGGPPVATPTTFVQVNVTATPGDDLPDVVYRALRDYQRRHVRPELAPLFSGRG